MTADKLSVSTSRNQGKNSHEKHKKTARELRELSQMKA